MYISSVRLGGKYLEQRLEENMQQSGLWVMVSSEYFYLTSAKTLFPPKSLHSVVPGRNVF